MTVLLAFGMLIGVLLCLWFVVTHPVTTTESLLLGVLLTIFSIIGSWLVSSYYAEYSYGSNLRVFALKASEKVTNLSNELERLAGFLQQELNSEDYTSPHEALLARDFRIEAAIHVINTLRSVNDRSLSDWEGVIGDEIIAQREEQEEREQTLLELLHRVESVEPAAVERNDGMVAPDLRRELDAIRKDVRVLSAQIGGVTVRQRRPTARVEVEQRCPKCHHDIKYSQRAKERSVKALQCEKCYAQLYSTFEGNGFSIHERVTKTETVSCPRCASANTVDLDPIPSSSTEVSCKECDAMLVVTRRVEGFSVRLASVPAGSKAHESMIPISSTVAPHVAEEFLDKVRNLLPSQPWPAGTASMVANKLGTTPGLVKHAIHELIRRGVYKIQVDGQLYVPEHSVAASHQGESR